MQETFEEILNECLIQSPPIEELCNWLPVLDVRNIVYDYLATVDHHYFQELIADCPDPRKLVEIAAEHPLTAHIKFCVIL